ncbi:receptor-type guanylate cyclase daf-11-like [Asterias rubens]|uniref:receptor-type guanylate cyclase daf-11-like n=1 Tax=Asterias rubens TaxID=7604 RepID=UPI00145527B8|nr:receptor-type guanylate cyclase daf-11-like [Asterias rubens]
MVMITLVPISILAVLCIVLMVNSGADNTRLELVRDRVGSSVQDAGELVHHLQIERGLSALYISSGAQDGPGYLVDVYKETDSVIQNITWNLEVDFPSRGYFNSKVDFIAHLGSFRDDMISIGVKNLTIPDVIDFYTRDIDAIMYWLSEDIKDYMSGGLWRQLIAYQFLILAKEHMGKERAIGGTFFSLGGFSSIQDYLWYLNETFMAETYLNTALQLSSFLQEAYKIDNELYDQLQQMRSEIHHNDFENLQPSLTKGDNWFHNMTFYIDILLKLQYRLADLIVKELDLTTRQGKVNVVACALLLCSVLLTGPIIILGIIRQTKCIQQVNENLHLKTKQLREQKKRADSLLYQMLPKTVAEQLKQTGNVPAETYDAVTVFFSDVVNFTVVSAISTPIQVIVMLNTLYQCLDGIIDRYDVYKVETIGDAYMVVSGVPQRNGNKHAPEMARLSLAICSGVSTVQIPHLLGSIFKLRIGIHTGPCAAGVVGSTRPRYCLFGDTINTASRMESTGEPGKIHISEAMRDALIRCGERFDIVLNGTLNIKGKGEMITYFLDGGNIHPNTELED